MISRLAKPLLGVVFVVAGVIAFRDMYTRVKEIEPLVDKTVGRLPDSVREGIPFPTDATTLATVDAAVKVGAGLALTFDKFPRLAAFALAVGLVPDSLATHAFWEAESAEARSFARNLFLRDAGLLGGLFMVLSERKADRQRGR